MATWDVLQGVGSNWFPRNDFSNQSIFSNPNVPGVGYQYQVPKGTNIPKSGDAWLMYMHPFESNQWTRYWDDDKGNRHYGDDPRNSEIWKKQKIREMLHKLDKRRRGLPNWWL